MNQENITIHEVNAVGKSIENYVSAMAQKRKYDPPPVLLALKDLGVTWKTMADVLGCTKAFTSAVSKGYRSLPNHMLPVLVELLSVSIQEARKVIEAAASDSKYPEGAIEHYKAAIAKAEVALKECRS